MGSKKGKKRRHERYFVRAGRPVTQLVSRREFCVAGSAKNLFPSSDARRGHSAAYYFNIGRGVKNLFSSFKYCNPNDPLAQAFYAI
jgi:hypothetical protein